MATDATARHDTTADPDGLTLALGSGHLALAGLINLATGAGLLWFAASGTLAELWVRSAPVYVDPTALLSVSGVAVMVIEVGAPLFGVTLLVLALVQLYGARFAASGRRRALCVAAGLGGALNPPATPVSLISVALFVLAGDEFS